MTLDPVTLGAGAEPARPYRAADGLGDDCARRASPIFSQSHDFSCFITDGSGTLISQADGIPIHTGGGGFACGPSCAPSTTSRRGTCSCSNDPYVAGGNHLPDWVIARPVFVDGRDLSPSPATAPTSPTSAAAPPAPTTPRRPRSSTKASACRR